MSIQAGQTALASDFVSTSSGASDSGKVPKLNSVGKIDSSFLRFGGSGSDGALTISSGTTNIDLAGAQVVVKNYTSISITGTGKLTFTNPHANGTTIIFKSQGNVTLTSSQTPMIDVSGIGSNYGQNDGYSFSSYKTNYGQNSVAWNDSGNGGAVASANIATTIISQLVAKYPFLVPGAGGGNNSNLTSGAGGGGSLKNAGSDGTTGSNTFATNNQLGGRGGGAFLIECGGSLNFTTASGISVSGKNGANGIVQYDGGGGGGGGGSCIILYNSLTSSSGTITSSGGTGGTGGANAGNGGNGGAGYSLVAQNTEFA